MNHGDGRCLTPNVDERGNIRNALLSVNGVAEPGNLPATYMGALVDAIYAFSFFFFTTRSWPLHDILSRQIISCTPIPKLSHFHMVSTPEQRGTSSGIFYGSLPGNMEK